MFSSKFCETSKNTFSYRTPPVAATVLGLYLFITHPCIFYIFHQVVRKPFKFISSGLETNDSLVNETNFLSFLSLFVYSFSAIAWQSVQTVVSINVNIQVYSYTNISIHDTAKICSNSFNTDM